ncbi:hypothetical protein HMN09_00704000 [Mycena chlorophos]|uniref:Uncharacterized protein n=1 Tax=Mycena chlorophos TaxID=658473 RepID=A0A8H6W7F1_MYCCL|nr:hypothetical protein HMN09_00704000 [Mycena chlorophos]
MTTLDSWNALVGFLLPPHLLREPFEDAAPPTYADSAPTLPAPACFIQDASLLDRLKERLLKFIALNGLEQVSFSPEAHVKVSILLDGLSGVRPDDDQSTAFRAWHLRKLVAALWREIDASVQFNGFECSSSDSSYNFTLGNCDLDREDRRSTVSAAWCGVWYAPRVGPGDAFEFDGNGAIPAGQCRGTCAALKQVGLQIELYRKSIQVRPQETVPATVFDPNMDIRFGMVVAPPSFCVVERGILRLNDQQDVPALLVSPVRSISQSVHPASAPVEALIALWFALSIPEHDIIHPSGKITRGVPLHRTVAVQDLLTEDAVKSLTMAIGDEWENNMDDAGVNCANLELVYPGVRRNIATIYRGTLEMDEKVTPVIFKTYPMTELSALRKEVSAYEQLASSGVVPMFYGAFELNVPSPNWIGFVLEDLGSSACPSWETDLQPADGESIFAALRLVHASGVKHGDVASRNVIHKDGRWYWVDFERSRCGHVCPGESCTELIRARARLKLDANR